MKKETKKSKDTKNVNLGVQEAYAKNRFDEKVFLIELRHKLIKEIFDLKNKQFKDNHERRLELMGLKPSKKR